MKQLLSLFLLLLPCLALAQYPSNGNQKITLGEQTTADGLVYRGVLADTGIITPSSDTSAYIILDTVNHRFYNYNRATNVWSMAGVGSISSGLTGVLPVANGGTNTTTLTVNKVMVGNGISGVLTPTNLHWANTNSRLGIRNSTPSNSLNVSGTGNGDETVVEFSNTGNLADANIVLSSNATVDSSQASSNFFFKVNGSNIALNGANPDFYQIRSLQPNVAIGLRTPGGFPVYVLNRRVWLGQDGNPVVQAGALVQIAAGTATASTAPLKFTSGTNLTTAEAGAMEFNGTNLFFSPSTTRHTVNHGLTGSATLNFPSTTTLLSADLTITVTGAALGDVVSLGVPNAAVNANTSYSAWVSAANTVTVRFNNYSSGTVDPASALFKVFVTK
jgi:hypothetical protein